MLATSTPERELSMGLGGFEGSSVAASPGDAGAAGVPSHSPEVAILDPLSGASALRAVAGLWVARHEPED